MEKKEIEVKQLQQVIDWMQKDGYDRKATQEIAPIIVKYLNQQPSWIACSERLPEETRGFFKCLIACHDNQIIMGLYNPKTKCFQDLQFKVIHESVTHWMTLPTPPAGQ